MDPTTDDTTGLDDEAIWRRPSSAEASGPPPEAPAPQPPASGDPRGDLAVELVGPDEGATSVPEPLPAPGWQGIRFTIGRAFDVYGSAFIRYLVLGVPIAIFSGISLAAGSDLLVSIVASLLTIVTAVVCGAAMMLMTDDIGRGADPSLASALDRAAGRAVPLVLSSIVVAAVGAGIGLAAFIAGVIVAVAGGGTTASLTLALVVIVVAISVPLSFVVVRWAVGGQAIVLDRFGPLAGLRRSWTLTRGHAWRMVGLYLTAGLLTGLASFGAGLLSAFADQRALVAVGAGLGTILATPLLAIALTIAYRDLTGWPVDPSTTLPSGRWRASVVAVVGGGILVFAAGIWAVSSARGLPYSPDRGHVIAGTSQNAFNLCRPNGVRDTFTSADAIWIGAIFSRHVPAGQSVVVEYLADGRSVGRGSLTAGPQGLDCYYEGSPIEGIRPGTYRVTITYASEIIADGSFAVR